MALGWGDGWMLGAIGDLNKVFFWARTRGTKEGQNLRDGASGNWCNHLAPQSLFWGVEKPAAWSSMQGGHEDSAEAQL